jgi:thiamine transporter ThiT
MISVDGYWKRLTTAAVLFIAFYVAPPGEQVVWFSFVMIYILYVLTQVIQDIVKYINMFKDSKEQMKDYE